MRRLHEGLDYLIYKVYVFGGFAAIFIFAIIMAFTGKIPETGNQGLVILGWPVTIWVLGILMYWWVVFLFKGEKELKESLKHPPDTTPEISALKNWNTLHTAMSLYGGDLEQLRKLENAGKRPILIWYGLQNLMAFWIFACFWAYVYYQDRFPFDIRWVMAYGMGVFLVLFLIGTPILLGITLKNQEDRIYKALNLERSLSSPKIEGAVVLDGRRLGRKVVIEFLNKRSRILVQVETPVFEISSQKGKLTPTENAPEAVVKALKSLRKAKRWVGINGGGSSGGVWVERESPGTNMWLYDLWLIERVLERFAEEM